MLRKFDFELFEVDFAKEIPNRLGAHFCDELVASVYRALVFLLRKELHVCKGGVHRVDDNVALVVYYAFEGLCSHVENQAKAARHAF